MKVLDAINGTVTEHKGVDEFNEWAKKEFDRSVWDDVDELCEHYVKGEPCQAEEALLGIEIL